MKQNPFASILWRYNRMPRLMVHVLAVLVHWFHKLAPLWKRLQWGISILSRPISFLTANANCTQVSARSFLAMKVTQCVWCIWLCLLPLQKSPKNKITLFRFNFIYHLSFPSRILLEIALDIEYRSEWDLYAESEFKVTPWFHFVSTRQKSNICTKIPNW